MAGMTATQPAPLPTRPTDAQAISDWLQTLYLEFTTADDKDLHISMREFLHINVLGYWLESDTINMALTLLTLAHHRRNVCVVPDSQGELLYRLGAGIYTLADMVDPTLKPSLEDETKRYVVVPCNDGWMQALAVGKEHEEWQIKAVEGRKNKGKRRRKGEDGRGNKTEEERKQDNVASEKHAGFGTHWGLLIIDKAKKTARWVDSLLTLGRNATAHYKIHSMHPSARAAGKVLRGFEQLLSTELGFRQGGFDAKTLKYVPNQGHHNKSSNDGGACGPYLFAFLAYLYRTGNETFMGDLETAFSKEAWIRDTHNKAMGFHSGQTRHAIQELVRRRREREECDDDLPYRLTPRLCRLLRLCASPQVLLDKMDGFQRCSETEERVEDDCSERQGLCSDEDGNENNNENNSSVKDTWLQAQVAKKPEPSHYMSQERRQALFLSLQQERANPKSSNDKARVRAKFIAHLTLVTKQLESWRKESSQERLSKGLVQGDGDEEAPADEIPQTTLVTEEGAGRRLDVGSLAQLGPMNEEEEEEEEGDQRRKPSKRKRPRDDMGGGPPVEKKRKKRKMG